MFGEKKENKKPAAAVVVLLLFGQSVAVQLVASWRCQADQLPTSLLISTQRHLGLHELLILPPKFNMCLMFLTSPDLLVQARGRAAGKKTEFHLRNEEKKKKNPAAP